MLIDSLVTNIKEEVKYFFGKIQVFIIPWANINKLSYKLVSKFNFWYDKRYGNAAKSK